MTQFNRKIFSLIKKKKTLFIVTIFYLFKYIFYFFFLICEIVFLIIFDQRINYT